MVITADNPVSCLYEYAKKVLKDPNRIEHSISTDLKQLTWKVKIADPEFSCIAENLLETWQKANQTFKKIEYTMQVQIK